MESRQAGFRPRVLVPLLQPPCPRKAVDATRRRSPPPPSLGEQRPGRPRVGRSCPASDPRGRKRECFARPPFFGSGNLPDARIRNLSFTQERESEENPDHQRSGNPEQRGPWPNRPEPPRPRILPGGVRGPPGPREWPKKRQYLSGPPGHSGSPGQTRGPWPRRRLCLPAPAEPDRPPELPGIQQAPRRQDPRSCWCDRDR